MCCFHSLSPCLLMVLFCQGLGVVCNKEGGFTEDDFVVEFLGEVMLHSDTSSYLLAAVAGCNVL